MNGESPHGARNDSRIKVAEIVPGPGEPEGL